jgi:hypothetical protein
MLWPWPDTLKNLVGKQAAKNDGAQRIHHLTLGFGHWTFPPPREA